MEFNFFREAARRAASSRKERPRVGVVDMNLFCTSAYLILRSLRSLNFSN